MKAVKILAGVLGLLLLVTGLAWLFRGDPIGPLSGRQLSGSERPYPDDWSFTDAHFTVAVESRPDDPHSVTTVCFVHEGTLYIPAGDGAEKRWTQFVLEDPRVRIKVGSEVYPARALRVGDLELRTRLASAARKYSSMAARLEGEPPEGIWLFRIAPRS